MGGAILMSVVFQPGMEPSGHRPLLNNVIRHTLMRIISNEDISD